MLNILIAECEDLMDGYEVIGVVGSESEALELMQSDMSARLKALEADTDPGICAYIYKMYQRMTDGYGCGFSRFAADLDFSVSTVKASEVSNA